MNTRLARAEVLPEQVKYPKILDKDSRLAEMIITHHHVTNAHSGPQFTQRAVRNEFWISGGKKMITSIIHKCTHRQCVANRAKAVIQDAPPLPKERFDSEVFTHVSADALGPFQMKVENVCHFKSTCSKCQKQKSKEELDEEENQKSCKTKKCWIVIFTCLATRNISLELLQDKTTESFIMAFQRHIAENSCPKSILTDNAAEYVRTDLELKKIMENPEVKQYFAEKGIKWNFTPAGSPQHNSVSESLVKQSKLALYGIFKAPKLTETELNTAIKLAQGKMNQRPLIAISDDPEDLNILCITPAHLKLGKALILLPSSFDSAQDLRKITVKTRWKQRQQIQRNFFIRFRQEYLLSLSKLQYKQNTNKELKIGDVVLLSDERRNRDDFPIGRITQVFRGSDNIIRSVELRLPAKAKTTKNADKTAANQFLNVKKPTFIRRGVEKICILESNPAVDSNLEREEQHENNNPNFNDSSCDDEVEQH